MTPRRGEVWLADLGAPVGREQGGARPVVVVSANPLNESAAGVVIVVPCTTSRRELPTHIELDGTDSGLDEISYAKCEDVKSVSTERLVHRAGQIGPSAQFEVTRALRFLLDL